MSTSLKSSSLDCSPRSPCPPCPSPRLRLARVGSKRPSAGSRSRSTSPVTTLVAGDAPFRDRSQRTSRGGSDRPPQLALAQPDVLTDRDLSDIGTVLINQPPPDPPGGMPLLRWRVTIRQQPLIDHRPIRPQLRRRPARRRALRRRYRRRQRLLHRPAMHPMPDGQPPNREPLPITVPSDLLELLHPGSHSLWRLPLELDEARTVGRRSDGGGASSDHHSGAS